MEFLILNVLSPQDRPIWTRLAEITTDHSCNMVRAQAQNFAAHSSFSALISGNWNNVAKLEGALKVFATENDLLLNMKRTKIATRQEQFIPYNVQVIGLNQIGTIFNVCNFFTSRGNVIELLDCETYLSHNTNTPMIIITLSVSLPAATNIAELREQFILFCEDLNIDGILEPDKR